MESKFLDFATLLMAKLNARKPGWDRSDESIANVIAAACDTVTEELGTVIDPEVNALTEENAALTDRMDKMVSGENYTKITTALQEENEKLKALLIETTVRCAFVLPATEEHEKWFDEGRNPEFVFRLYSEWLRITGAKPLTVVKLNIDKDDNND